jgi:hypothetical protein
VSTTREKDVNAALASLKHSYSEDRVPGYATGYVDGRLDGCAHRDKQTVAFLLEREQASAGTGIADVIRALRKRFERMEHVR